MTSASGGRAANLTPDEAFAVLGNEIRIHTLQALWEADTPLTYSELKERVGVQNSGQFNYHLDQLIDHFVEKSGAGYKLRVAGEEVVATVLAGTLTDDPAFDSVELDGSCPHCGAAVEAAYADETLTVWCTSEEGHIPADSRPGTLKQGEFPPAGLTGRTPDEVVRASMTWGDSRMTPMFDGVCPRCAGPVSLTIQVCDHHEGGRGRICENCNAVFAVWARRLCDVCRFEHITPAWTHILRHPDVSGFFHEHGMKTTSWTWEVLTAEVIRPTREFISEDPFRLQFRFEADGDGLDVTLDGELDVIGVDPGGE